MSTVNYSPSSTPEPDLVDAESLDQAGPSENHNSQARDSNDRRLIQAINYVRERGGSDSPQLFLQRLESIKDGLLTYLPEAHEPFTHKLYSNLRDMVDQVTHEAPVGSPTAHLEPRRSESADNIPQTREFKYGGPKNPLEVWHNGRSSHLPFAETFQLARWESLKIREAARNAIMNSDDQNAVTAIPDVPFDHPELQQYKYLGPYESGSRFKLPYTGDELEERVAELGTEAKLNEALRSFNQGNRDREIEKDHAPRIFLDKFAPSKKYTATAIRKSLNTTPTKRRQILVSSVSTTIVDNDTINSSDETPLTIPDGDQAPPSTAQPAASLHSSPPQPQSHSSPVARRISRHRADAVRSGPPPGSPPNNGSENDTPSKAPTYRVTKTVNPKITIRGPEPTAPRAGTPTPQPKPAVAKSTPRVSFANLVPHKTITPGVVTPQPKPALKPALKPTVASRVAPSKKAAPDATVAGGPLTPPRPKTLGKRKRNGGGISEDTYTPNKQASDKSVEEAEYTPFVKNLRNAVTERSEHGSDDEDDDVEEPPAKRVTRSMSKSQEAEKEKEVQKTKAKPKGKPKPKGKEAEKKGKATGKAKARK
ncbi:hypothetical protein IQ07DRAFT_22979 [Pyrenochaeta sp. DS3sAY3a]|nr:hypothetical protein IQ07DRAFT_22979 [Pyrenochaeta sp. DS3sAY3a]